MQPADCAAHDRNNVIDLVRNASFHRDPGCLFIDRPDCVQINPWRRSLAQPRFSGCCTGSPKRLLVVLKSLRFVGIRHPPCIATSEMLGIFHWIRKFPSLRFSTQRPVILRSLGPAFADAGNAALHLPRPVSRIEIPISSRIARLAVTSKSVARSPITTEIF